MFRSVLRPSLRNYYVSACLLRRIPVCCGMLSVIYKYLYYSLRNVVIWDIDYYTRGCVAYLCVCIPALLLILNKFYEIW